LALQPILLTIAGFDPSSGAGVTADLATFASHGCFGVSAITALTVQSTVGVRWVHPTEPEILAATLVCLDDDLPPAGIKIGMLATEEIVAVVSDYVERVRDLRPDVWVVLDPVLRSSSGRELLSAAGIDTLQRRLLRLADWTTPNLDELAVLTGLTVDSPQTVEAAAEALQSEYPRLGVVATGGHIDPPNDYVLAPGKPGIWIEGIHVESRATHGTGCAFSSALLAGLVLGVGVPAGVSGAKHFVAEGIRLAPGLGSGKGPMNLGWPRVRSQ